MDEAEAVILGHLRHAREQMDAARGLLVRAMQMDLTIQVKNTVAGLEVAVEWIKRMEEKRVKTVG
jgi:hypothetical protein